MKYLQAAIQIVTELLKLTENGKINASDIVPIVSDAITVLGLFVKL
jgi:hypothetical protein